MANEEAKARLARMIDPVVTEAGFKAVGRADWKTRFPRVWRRDLGNRIVHELSLDAGTRRRFYYLHYGVCVRMPKSGSRAAHLETAIHGICNELHDSADYQEFFTALSKDLEQPEDKSAAFVRKVLEKSVFPALDTVATLRDIIECFLTDRFSMHLVQRARIPLGLPKTRYPAPHFDLPAFGTPGARLTDDVVQQGEPCLLAVWKKDSPDCGRWHQNITRLKAEHKLPLYGIAVEKDQTVEGLAEFFDANGNPFDICGYDPTGSGLDRSKNHFNPHANFPRIYVVDGEGLIVGQHVGTQITKWEFEEELPEMIAQARIFYDWPVPEWPHTHERGRRYLPD